MQSVVAHRGVVVVLLGVVVVLLVVAVADLLLVDAVVQVAPVVEEEGEALDSPLVVDVVVSLPAVDVVVSLPGVAEVIRSFEDGASTTIWRV